MKNTFIIIVGFFGFCISGFAQPTKLSEPHSCFIAMVVSNIDTSVNWYRSNLGMKLKNRVESKERGFKQANLTRSQIHIELIELNSMVSKKDVSKNEPNKEIQGVVKFGFVVKDFNNWYSQMLKQKVRFHGKIVRDDETGKRMFLIEDPDDNKIQIFEE
jgi:hypothetical protein